MKHKGNLRHSGKRKAPVRHHIAQKPKKHISALSKAVLRMRTINGDLDDYIGRRRKLDQDSAFHEKFYKKLLNSLKSGKSKIKEKVSDFIVIESKGKIEPSEDFEEDVPENDSNESEISKSSVDESVSEKIIQKSFFGKIASKFTQIFSKSDEPEEDYDLDEDDLSNETDQSSKQRVWDDHSISKSKNKSSVLRRKELPDVDEPLREDFKNGAHIAKKHREIYKTVLKKHSTTKKDKKEFESEIDREVEKDLHQFEDEIPDNTSKPKNLLTSVRKWIRKREEEDIENDSDNEIISEKEVPKESPKSHSIQSIAAGNAISKPIKMNAAKRSVNAVQIEKDIDKLDDLKDEFDKIDNQAKAAVKHKVTLTHKKTVQRKKVVRKVSRPVKKPSRKVVRRASKKAPPKKAPSKPVKKSRKR